ncbi:MAG: formyltransferase family protein, partial [Pirellula sp.]
MNVILCGYHWTGCEALRQLVELGHHVFVYTHESPYHIPSLISYCQKTNTPYSLENVSRSKLPFRPDCVASIYYRNIIKRSVIEASDGRIFNLHPALLPAYRGCSSLTWALIDGRDVAGYTYHYVDEGCDTGRILLQEEVPIRTFDTQQSLYERVAFEAMNRFREAIERVMRRDPGSEQMGTPTYFPRGCPHNGQIDPSWPDEYIERFIRAMIYPPYPTA